VKAIQELVREKCWRYMTTQENLDLDTRGISVSDYRDVVTEM